MTVIYYYYYYYYRVSITDYSPVITVNGALNKKHFTIV